VSRVIVKVKSKYFREKNYQTGLFSGHAAYLCVAGNEIVSIIFMICRIQSVTAIIPNFLAAVQNIVFFWSDMF
jgi:hypothetical protein